MSFTVVPLHGLHLPHGTVRQFGIFTVQDVPEWLRKDKVLFDLGRRDRDLISHATHALVSEYEAEAYGSPDPGWPGPEPRSIQDLRWEKALLANMALWLAMPSPLCVTVGFHALAPYAEPLLEAPRIIRVDIEPRLLCSDADEHVAPAIDDVVEAAQLFGALSQVPGKNSVWSALRAFWAALTSYRTDIRYPLFWQGLESLFGSEAEERGISERLRNRIACFLTEKATTRDRYREQVRWCYKQRSLIVHGRWQDTQEFRESFMLPTEQLVREVLARILKEPGMLSRFLSGRDAFLETLTRSEPPTSVLRR